MSPYPSQQPDAVRAYNRAYYLANRDRLKAASKRYAAENREKANAHKLAYRKTPKGRATENARRREREATDACYAMHQRVRRRLHAALNGRKITIKSLALIGCSREELSQYIERRFLPGMTWENRSAWEIDHKRPLSSFDLTDEAQLREAAHYTNLQPLWREDNRKKGAKWP